MKKLLFQTDSSLAKTGFGRNAKALLSYLYKTKKYDIVHYCCGSYDHKEHGGVARYDYHIKQAFPNRIFMNIGDCNIRICEKYM